MANNIEYVIYWDAAQVETMLLRGGTGFAAAAQRVLMGAAAYVKGEVSAAAPEGVAGSMGQGLKNHIGVTYPAPLTALIKPDDSIPYADAVETGSRPHMPPVNPDGALAQWCEMKGLSLWPVAMSIARKGTKAHPYIKPTYERTEPQVTEMMSAGIGQYIEGLSYASL